MVVYSCEHPAVAEGRLGALLGFPMTRMKGSRVSEFLVHYNGNLKFVLDDPENRVYSVYRMCYRGEGGWMFLDYGTLESLAKKTMPHLELDSFYELM